MNLSMAASSIGEQTVLEIAGEVDLHTAGRLADRLTALLDTGPRTLVVELSSLSFLDSTGLGALVSARNHARRDGVALRLVCVPERLLKLFRITGLHTAFEIYPTVSQALAAGGGAPNVPVGQG